MSSTISFLVEDNTFDIPIEKIPKGCLLLELHKASEKFHVEKVDGSILLDVDLEEFVSVYRYLVNGTLNKNLYLKVQHLFEYLMIDYNEYGYPLEFFEIKKEEDYMRTNFYNPLFKDHNMRSMYYNLIEVTEGVYNDIFVSGESSIKDPRIITSKKGDRYTRSYKDFISCLDEIISYFKLDKVDARGIYICGGSLISLAMCCKLRDMDLFLVNRDESAIEEIFSIYTKKNKPQFYRTENCASVRLNREDGQPYNFTLIDLQIILRKYSTISEVITGFDVDCCGICYELSTGKLYVTPRAMYAIKHRLNIVDFDRISLTYEHRLIKYADRGFDIFVPFFDIRKVHIDRIDIKDTYSKSTKNSIKTLIRYKFNIYKYDLSIHDYDVIHNQIGIVPFAYFRIKTPKEFDTKKLESKLDTIGLKINASIPGENYTTYLVSIYNYDCDGEGGSIVDGLNIHGDIIIEPQYMSDTFFNPEYCRESTKDKDQIKYYITRNYKIAMRLPDDVYRIVEQATNLPQSIRLQTIESGKLNGNFHHIVIEDYRKWYKCKLYNF